MHCSLYMTVTHHHYYAVLWPETNAVDHLTQKFPGGPVNSRRFPGVVDTLYITTRPLWHRNSGVNWKEWIVQTGKQNNNSVANIPNGSSAIRAWNMQPGEAINLPAVPLYTRTSYQGDCDKLLAWILLCHGSLTMKKKSIPWMYQGIYTTVIFISRTRDNLIKSRYHNAYTTQYYKIQLLGKHSCCPSQR